MKKIPVIFDCDPGHDDAIAMVLAFATDKIEVLGVTTASGNQSIEKTTLNARRICEFLGRRDVPVAQGRSNPLLTPARHAGNAHGESGLDGPALPDPVAPLSPLRSVELMAKLLAESEEKVTLVPTGPLTNIATLLLAYPELKNKIERICMMGGSLVSGCSDRGASEFNVLVDAYAADIVFTSGLPIVMMGLDVTNYSTIGYFEEKETLRAAGRVGRFVAELADFFGRGFQKFGWPGVPIHDACTIAWLIDPTIFTSREVYLEMDLDGENTFASTVADFNNLSGRRPNVTVCLHSDQKRFFRLLLDACKSYEEGGQKI